MLAEDLTRLKQELKQILPEEGISTVIKAIKSHVPSDAPKYNAILHIESRLNEANLKRVKGVLSEDQLQLAYNQLRDDLLSFIDDLKPEDFSKEAAKKSKTGSILYKIPREMEFKQRCKCIVRLAYEEAVIVQNIELTSDTALQSVRISEAMEVTMIDPDGGRNFAITSISSPEQFLEEDDYSEWVFYVTPLTVGSHPIILKVSVLELVAGKERKKEIVLEEIVTIVTQPVEEEEEGRSFQNAGYSFAFSGIATEGIADQKSGKSSVPSTAAATVKKYSMVLGAFTMLLMASWAMGLLTFFSWQQVMWSDQIEDYEAFMLKYPDSKYFILAKQHRDLKVAIREKSDSMLVDFLVDYPDSEMSWRAKSAFREISNDNLDERVKKRRAERAKKEKDKSDKASKTKKGKEDASSESELSPGGDSTEVLTEEVSLDSTQEEVPSGDRLDSAALNTRTPQEATGLANSPIKNLPSGNEKPDALSWLELNMVSIEGGKFTMGCDDGEPNCGEFNRPKREVKVKDFRLCKYEVTQGLWETIMGYNNSYGEARGCSMCPIEKVSFREVMDFIKKLNRKSGKKYRLPSEAEWEYAARGGANDSGTAYSGSDDFNAVAWHRENSGKRPQPVGRKLPNALGIYDMTGSVKEWCEDTWNPNFEGAPRTAKPWVKAGLNHHRIVKGGSWNDDPEYLQINYRDMDVDSLRNHLTGFRLASD